MHLTELAILCSILHTIITGSSNTLLLFYIFLCYCYSHFLFFSVSPHSSVLSTATLLHLMKTFRLFKKDPFTVDLFESESRQDLQHCMLVVLSLDALSL